MTAGRVITALSVVLVYAWVMLPMPSVFAACSGSTPTWTTTPDSASVQACVNAASVGDTINVLAGSVTWSTQVVINKGLTIVGAGVGQTIIGKGTAANIPPLLWNVPAGQFADVSHITFDENFTPMTGGPGFILVAPNGHGPSGTGNYRIHHNDFVDLASNGVRVAPQIVAETSGLIDHNTFSCPSDSTRCQYVEIADCGSQENAMMDFAPSFGTSNKHYIEDNVATYSYMQDGGVEGYGCARYVVRFNIHRGASQSHHGNDSGNRRGTKDFEYYLNDFYPPTIGTWSGRVSQVRSGTGMIWGNRFANAIDGGINPYLYRVDKAYGYGKCDGSSPWDGNDGSGSTYPAAGWPCVDSVGWWFDALGGNPGGTYTKMPMYTFLNRKVNGTQFPAVQSAHPTHMAANAEFFNEDTTNCSTAGSSCTAGVGSGTRAQMDAHTTCTQYTGFWVTDEGTWNAGGNTFYTGQGRLYQCGASNNWVLYYTPYTYPHPLQGFETGTVPDTPTSFSATGGNQLANLVWVDQAEDETAYVVERGLVSNCSDCVPVANLGANVQAYQDTGLAHNTTYYYRVKATNLAGSSAYSNIDSATTDAPPDIDDEICTEEYEAGSDTSIDCTIAATVPNGASIAVPLGFVGAQTVSGCTDTQSNTYTALTTVAVNGTRKVHIWIARNVSGGDNIVVTCTFTGAVTERGMGAQAVSGLGNNPQIDDQDDDVGTGTSATAGAVTATVADTYMLSVFSSASASGTPTATTCTIVHDSASGFGVAVETTTASGDKTCTFTIASADWVAQTVVLKAEAETDPLPDPRSEYFVDNSGSPACVDDPTQPGSEAEPFCSVTYAVSRMAGTNDLRVKAGTYNGVFSIGATLAGTAVDPTVFRLDSGVTIQGAGIHTGRIAVSSTSYVQWFGGTVTLANNCFRVDTSTFIVIQGVTCTMIGQDALRVRLDSSFVSLIGNTVDNTGQYMSLNGEGIYIGTGSMGTLDNTNNVLISGNTIHDTTDEAIELKPGTHDHVVENNTISNCIDMGAGPGSGIEYEELILGDQTWNANPNVVIRGNRISNCYVGIRLGSGGEVYNNIVYGTLGGRNCINITNDDADSYPRLVYHNTVTCGTSAAIVEFDSPTVTSANNIGPTTAGTNLAYDAANHEAPASGNFKLKATATGAINQGSDVTATVATDIDGKTRPFGSAPDIGAHEFGSNRPRRLRVQ